MGVVTLTGMFRNCVRASHPAQPRPAQRIFSFVFWEGGGEGKGRGGSGWRVRRIRQPKEPWQAAGTSSDGALDVSNPSTRDTYLLLFFCLFLWMPCLYDYYYYDYYDYYYSYSVTTLVKEGI